MVTGYDTVVKARGLMRAGYSMKDAARLLGVMASDLDRWLWSCIGISDESLTWPQPKQPEPMF